MKKKMRKFAEGGSSIDEGVRARAMKFVENASEESRDIGEPVASTADKSTSKVSQTVAPAKPKVDMEAEKKRIEDISKKQALEKVSPELDFMPAGKLALGAGALYAGARAIGKRILAGRAEKEVAEKAVEKVAKNVARKSEEGFSPAEALEKLNPTKVHNIAGRKIPQKRMTKKSQSAEGMADDGGSGAFKRGGSVRSSASRRADGCAIRGKTRA